MITRFEVAEYGVLIHSRRTQGGRTVLASAVASLLMVTSFLLVGLGLSMVVDGEPSIELGYRDIALLAMAVVVPFVISPWALRGWERIEIQDAQLTYMRGVGGMRTTRKQYDLLKMKGLRLPPILQETGTRAPGLQYWYAGGHISFGDTLTSEERDSVLEAMLEHDVRLRESLGMDVALGLANTDWWESDEARQATLDNMYANQRYI